MNFRMMQAVSLYCLAFLVASCCNFTTAERQLGNNFAFVNWDGNTKKIIYCTSTSCCNAGFEVVPSYVESTDHDADWIVAKALHGDSTTYWIVDKRFKVDLSRCEVISCDSTVKAHTFGPLRYAAYLKAIDSLGIELRID